MSQPNFDRITQDPNVLDGLPTIRDTGITVSELVKALMGGKTADEVLAEQPHLESEDVTQALMRGVRDLLAAMSLVGLDLRNHLTSIQVSGMVHNKKFDDLTAEARTDLIDSIMQSTSDAKERLWDYTLWAEWIYDSSRPTITEYFERKTLNELVESALKKSGQGEHQVVGLDEPVLIRSSWCLERAIRALIVNRLDLPLNTGASITVVRTEQSPSLEINRYSEKMSQFPYVEGHYLNGTATPLFVVAHIIRQHGSQLKIHPTEDGVTFEFDLPIWSEPHE
jgi:uncharacterized protein (DUF433 family)